MAMNKMFKHSDNSKINKHHNGKRKLNNFLINTNLHECVFTYNLKKYLNIIQ